MENADQMIFAALDETQFASIRHLSRLTHLSSDTIYQQLTQSLAITASHLRWAAYILSDDQNMQGVEQSRLSFWPLEHNKVVPGKASFYFTMSHEFPWLPDGEKVPQRERPMIQSKGSWSELFGILKDPI
jgi:hypothetical protein